MARLWLSCIALPLLVGACGGAAGSAKRASDRNTREAQPGPVLVVGDDPSLPPGCRPRQVARLLQDFIIAFNRGERTAADFVVFGVAPGGGWYSMSEGAPRNGGRHFVARDIESLRRYFAARHRRHERLQLREVIVGYANALGQIEYKLTRRADDLRRRGITTSGVEGKGAVDCERRRVVVWSMGMVSRDTETGRLCPRPATAEKQAAVACSRRWRR